MDNAGGGSSIRVLMLIWGIVLLSSWGYVSIKTTALAPIPESVIVVFLGLVGSKVAQRPFEKTESVPAK